MKPILSIIIPAFNASRYIEKCLDSIFNNDCFGIEYYNLFETIVVDDCSEDTTAIIVEDYIAKNQLKNLFLYSHKKNRKQGAARNTGLQFANGNYVWFVDVDDIVMSDMLSLLKDNSLPPSIDVIQFNAASEDLVGNRFVDDFLKEPLSNLSGVEYLEFEARMHYSNRIRAPWSKWYRREFLLQNELFFEENIYWEDVVHTLKSIYLSKIFMYIPLVGYVYVQTQNSDMRGVQNGQKIADVIRFCVDSFEFLQKQGASITIIEFQREYYERVLRKYKYNLHFLQKKDFDIFDNVVSKFDFSVIEKLCHNDEHNWLNTADGRFKTWRTNNEN